MKKKIDTSPTFFDLAKWDLQAKLKQAEARVQEANAKLEAEREALGNCSFSNESCEYERDVREAEKLRDEAYATREQIIKEIQNLEK